MAAQLFAVPDPSGDGANPARVGANREVEQVAPVAQLQTPYQTYLNMLAPSTATWP